MNAHGLRCFGALLLAVFCGHRMSVPILPGVTVPAQVLLLAVLFAAALVGVRVLWPRIRSFRSSPYPRIVPHWSARFAYSY